MQKHHVEKPHISDEPVFWLLFGAGGMAVAMALPSIIILFLYAGITQPDLNEGMLSFAHVRGMFGNWLVSILIFSVIAGVSIHAHHRIYHTLHDLSLPATKLAWFAFYGAAGALAIFPLALQVLIYVKLF